MAGYTGCLAEVSRFLAQTNGINQELREKIIHHMTEKVRDTNNNERTEGDDLTKPAKQVPVLSRVPSKHVNENSEISSAKKIDHEIKSELRSSDIDSLNKGNETCTDSELNNLQNSAAGLFPGSQVLLVLQLPPAHNMMTSNPFAAPLPNFAHTANNAVSVFQSGIPQEAVDLSQPQTKTSRNVLNPHPARQTVDDPAAILGSSFRPCDIYTQRTQTIQTSPLDLCTNTGKHEQPSMDDDHWRPW